MRGSAGVGAETTTTSSPCAHSGLFDGGQKAFTAFCTILGAVIALACLVGGCDYGPNMLSRHIGREGYRSGQREGAPSLHHNNGSRDTGCALRCYNCRLRPHHDSK